VAAGPEADGEGLSSLQPDPNDVRSKQTAIRMDMLFRPTHLEGLVRNERMSKRVRGVVSFIPFSLSILQSESCFSRRWIDDRFDFRNTIDPLNPLDLWTHLVEHPA